VFVYSSSRNVKKQKKMVEGIPIFEYLLVGSSKVAKNRELLSMSSVIFRLHSIYSC
jgi:hypothetical protein